MVNAVLALYSAHRATDNGVCRGQRAPGIYRLSGFWRHKGAVRFSEETIRHRPSRFLSFVCRPDPRMNGIGAGYQAICAVRRGRNGSGGLPRIFLPSTARTAPGSFCRNCSSVPFSNGRVLSSQSPNPMTRETDFTRAPFIEKKLKKIDTSPQMPATGWALNDQSSV